MAGNCDVLVVGGGLAGSAAAYYLAKAGVGVRLIERGDLNTKASGSNAGSIHAQIPHLPFVEEGEDWARTFGPTIGLLVQSVELWKGLSDELGEPLGVETPGGLLVAETEPQMREIARKTAIEKAFGLDVEVIDRATLRQLAPYVSERMIGGSYSPGEGKANPLVAAPAFARAARRLGAHIETLTELLGLKAEAGGYVAQTNRGVIRARRVLDCAGADAGRVAALLGIDLPIQGHPIQVAVTEPAEPLVRHLVYFAGDRLTLKQLANGTCLVGGGWPSRVSERTGRLIVDADALGRNLEIAVHVVPRLASLRIVRVWPAMVNGTADWKPILGEVPGHPGFFISMFPWLGFSAGPLAARIVTDLILGRTPEVDLTAFSAARY
ncbi:MAG: FAD-binding oxidoreductase [Hyphomicrobiaceae bacterium]